MIERMKGSILATPTISDGNAVVFSETQVNEVSIEGNGSGQ